MVSDLISFYYSDHLVATKAFYEGVLGFHLWKDQGSCLIFDVGGHGKIGFCDHFRKRDMFDDCLTFVFAAIEDVIAIRERLMKHGHACGPLTRNEQFAIDHFFSRDPNGLRIEFQIFLGQ